MDNRSAYKITSRFGIALRRLSMHAALLLLPFLVTVHTGYIGLDFGTHWDEHLQCRLVARSVKSGVLLPGVYNYPMIPYWLTVAALGPRFFGPLFDANELLNDLNDVKPVELNTTELQNYVLKDHGFFLRVRLIFLLVSSLACVWTYLLVLVWRRRAGEAFLAAAFLALSWEAAYHARWIAPDQIMTSFAALTMLLAAVARAPGGDKRWLYGAAVAAALATAAKYQAGLLLLPLLLVTYQIRDPMAGPGETIGRAVRVLGNFAVTFLLVTPGAYLDPRRFVSWLVMVIVHYGKGGHQGYDVPAGVAELGKICVYLGSDYFSYFLPVALFLTGMVFAGLWAFFRETPRQSLVFFCVPAIYLAYMTRQNVFIVRNFLLVGPFLAVAAARGVSSTLAWLGSPKFRVPFGALIAAALVANVYWLYSAAWSIPGDTPAGNLKKLATYVAQQPPHSVYPSASIRHWLKVLHLDSPRLADRPEDANELAFYPDDWENFATRPSNVSRFAYTWFGPFELNWNYYTNWAGSNRILMVTAKNAKAAKVHLK